jgi:putative restriction endonuclease
MNNEGAYIRTLQNLHRDSIPGRWTEITMGKAPHKPLLLLCVSDLYRENSSRENRIEPTLYIEESFDAYWRKLFEIDNNSTFAFPFFHLQHDGFWSLVDANGSNVADPAIARSASALRNAVAFAKIAPELHDLLCRPEWNCHLRSVIITSNFDPDVHARLVEH